MRTRVLTITDLHQSRLLFEQLQDAVKTHRPDVVAFVGDFLLESEITAKHIDVKDLAGEIAKLPVEHIIFSRGNHEGANWPTFVFSWPHEKRPLVALYGSAFKAGPLTILGFPCDMGWEEPWCETMPKAGNIVTLDPEKCGVNSLPAYVDKWLPKVAGILGANARHLWLMHEPPTQLLGCPATWNPQWGRAVERYAPLVVVSGHDHESPIANKSWHVNIADTLCVNVGQMSKTLHYCMLDFDFGDGAKFPLQVTVSAFPWREDSVMRCLK